MGAISQYDLRVLWFLVFPVLWIHLSPGALGFSYARSFVVLPVVSILTGGEEDVSLRIREKRQQAIQEIEEPSQSLMRF